MNVPAPKSPSGEGRLGDDVTEARHDLKAECRIYRRSLLSAFESIPPELRPQAIEKLLGHCQARPLMRILNNLFKVAAVAGYSIATAECVFPARNRIDTPCRRRLTPHKQGNLTVLHFEKKIVRDVRFPEFLSKFVAKKSRRLRV